MCLYNGKGRNSSDSSHSSDYDNGNEVEMRPTSFVAADAEQMNTQLEDYIQPRLQYLLEQNGIISIGVSGGSMPPIFTKAFLNVTDKMKNLNWKRIRIFMVDERNVEIHDEDSNLGAYLKLFPENLHEIFVPFQYFKDPRTTAHAYEINLRKYLLPEQHNSFARFDMVFLGVGPDGHTASIFPGRERLEKVTDLYWVAAIADSPKPPAQRITITQQCLQYSKNMAFIITGESKAEVVRGIVFSDHRYPAATVRPYNGKLNLFLDEPAASRVMEGGDSDGEDSDSPPPLM